MQLFSINIAQAPVNHYRPDDSHEKQVVTVL